MSDSQYDDIGRCQHFQPLQPDPISSSTAAASAHDIDVAPPARREHRTIDWPHFMVTLHSQIHSISL
ncbi:hypothetical protein XI08_32235 [Bradyrhizobium sp. CCBAU 11361]|nr:hypothetical protein [Bradyrhizobium sp. CCBAU 11361]